MAKLKVVIVIVEGPTDYDALGIILNRIYKNKKVFVQVMRGDVTSRSDVNMANVLGKIWDAIEPQLKINRWQKKDIQEIIHIIDMDGAYVPDELVLFDHDAEKPVYSGDNIRTCDVTGIVHRNQKKRENIDKISMTPKLAGIPYQAYFMSCNLDHALYGKLNSSDEEKENDAHVFSKKYKDLIVDFVEFISESSFSVKKPYLESWSFVKKGKNSLKRYTNLNICIERALSGEWPVKE